MIKNDLRSAIMAAIGAVWDRSRQIDDAVDEVLDLIEADRRARGAVIYQAMANDDDDNPTSRNLWLDISDEDYQSLRVRHDMRVRVVYASAVSSEPVAWAELHPRTGDVCDFIRKDEAYRLDEIKPEYVLPLYTAHYPSNRR